VEDLRLLLEVFASHQGWRLHRKLGDALKHVLRGIGREVGDQLVVDGEIRCEYEEVTDAVFEVKVRNERAHEPRLADAGSEGEAKARERVLEVFYRWELRPDDVEHGLEVTAPRLLQLVWLRDLHDAVEDLERPPLWRPKRETSGNAVDVTAGHHLLPLSIPSNSGSDCTGVAFLRRAADLALVPLLPGASAFASSTATMGACSVTFRL